MRRYSNIKLRSVFLFAVVSILTIVMIAANANATVYQIDTTTQILTVNGQNPDAFPVAIQPETLVTVTGQVIVSGDPTPPPPQGTITLQYQLQGTNTWTETTTIPITIRTSSTGSFSGQFIAPESPGVYNLRAVFKGDNSASQEQHGDYHWKNSEVTVLEAFVVPEYPLAAMAALFSCFGAFFVFKKRSKLPKLHSK